MKRSVIPGSRANGSDMRVVKVVVDSRLRLESGSIDPETEEDLVSRFTHSNPKHFAVARFNRWAASREPREIKTWEISDGEISFPRGGVGRLREVLRDRGYALRFDDRRVLGRDDWRRELQDLKHEPLGHDNPGGEPWDHQVRIVEAIVSRQNCVVRAGTGSGKTTGALMGFAAVKLPTLVVLDDSRLFDQWIRRAEKELAIPGSRVGRIGGGKWVLRPLTIALQQSLRRMSEKKWREVESSFGMVLADECHVLGAQTFIQTIDRMPAKYRVGISADETRPDKREFLIYDVMGDVAVDVPQSELVAAGHTVNVEVRVVITDFEADWYVQQRLQSHCHHEQRDDAGICERCGLKSRNAKPPDLAGLMNQMGEDDERNELCVSLAMNEVRNGRQVLVFSHRRDHCIEMNRRAAEHGVASGLVLGGGATDKDESARSIAGLTNGSLRWASGTIKAIGKGLDLPSVEAGVLTMPISSRQPLDQAKGRLCRKPDGKTSAVLYVVHDIKVFGDSQVRKIAGWFRSVFVVENGKSIPAREWIKNRKDDKHGEEKRVGGTFGGSKRRKA